MMQTCLRAGFFYAFPWLAWCWDDERTNHTTKKARGGNPWPLATSSLKQGDESVGGFAGLKSSAGFIQLLLRLEFFWRSRLAFQASHHGGGLLESGFGGSGIDGAAQFGFVHQNGDFISIHFGKTQGAATAE